MADKHGMGKLLRYTMFALGLNFLIMALTMPFNAYPMQIIGNFSESILIIFLFKI
jgi:hypothetical protein